jgi:hypothetical protein
MPFTKAQNIDKDPKHAGTAGGDESFGAVYGSEHGAADARDSLRCGSELDQAQNGAR